MLTLKPFGLWWAQVDSNHRPHAYQACALTTWAMRPFRLKLTGYSFFLYPLAFRLWWRWGGSNSWPPACKAGALPAELHPHFFQGLRIAILFPSLFKLLKVLLEPSKLNNALSHYKRTLTDRSPKLYFKLYCLLRKEVIQPHLPIRLPCYDFTPVINPTFDCALQKVKLQASGVTDSHGVTGGVYKARERIHRSMLICDY